MFYKKKGLPEEGELVVCTVKKILYHSVFASLDEYENKEGMIHISEISPGRIRTLSDFVKEGKQIVCKVIRIDNKKQHIDLSLRRVTTQIRINKLNDYKQEEKAEKLLTQIGKRLNKTLKQIYDEIGYKAIAEYGSLNLLFQQIVSKGKKVIEKLNIDKKLEEEIYTTIIEKIKLPKVTIKRNISLISYDPDGIDKIKKALDIKEENVKISYVSAPNYSIEVESANYKAAEIVLKNIIEKIEKSAKPLNLIMESVKIG